MSKEKLPIPSGLCKACQAKAMKSGQQWCPENQAGALYVTSDNLSYWQIHQPVGQAQFFFMVEFLKISKTQVVLTSPAEMKPETKAETHD